MATIFLFGIFCPSSVILAQDGDYISEAEIVGALQSVPGLLDTSGVGIETNYADDSMEVEGSDGSTIEIPADASEGVGLDGGGKTPVHINLPNAEHSSFAEEIMPGVVSYSSDNGSASVVQSADSGGVRMMTVIDAPQAPTAYEYEITTPGGGHIELAEDGGAYILNDEGNMIGLIESPWAKDSSGKDINTWFSTDGSILVQHVMHNIPGILYPVVADPYYLGVNMNSAEFSWCKWPSRYKLCSRAYSLSKEATNGANYLSQKYKWSTHNGGADAVRHCYWSGLMAYHFGYSTSKGFGDRHEQSPQPAAEKAMDLHNNEMGRRWAHASGGVWSRCINGMHWGQLKRLVK